MEIKVVRSVLNPTVTLGKMFIDDVFFAYTLEDTVRNLNGDCSKKIPQQTAIDCGRYELILNYSNRFGKYLPLLLNVPCFDAIRIHGGNTEKDTEGCILVGEQSNMTDKIWNCASRLNALVAQIKAVEKKEKIFVNIQ
jgi:hypothetical protein